VARGHLELADQQDPEDLGRTIDLVLDEIDRMTRLVNELTLLAAATRPDFVRRSEMDAGDLIATVFEKARVLAERDWQVVVGQDVSLSADRQRLTQAMLQLAQNAVQHTESGQQITLGADADDGHVRLWVRDAGEGIEPSEQHEVFRRFYRGKSPGDHGASGHTGLGLSIVSAIAEAHGGTVELASAPGSGATFTLVIPRRIPTPISNGTGRSRDHGGQHGDPIAP
jgi:signal transduction histidine kinase